MLDLNFTKSKAYYWFFSLLGLMTYILLRVMLLKNYAHDYIPIQDAAGYIQFSKLSFLSVEFWYSRPFLYPLFLKLTSAQQQVVFLFQAVISSMAWWLFSCLIFKELQMRYKSVFALLVSFFVLFFPVIIKTGQFDSCILTESLNNSLFILNVFSLLKFNEKKFNSIFWSVFFAMTQVFLVSLRDSNVYYVLLLTPLFAIFIIMQTRLRPRLILISIFLVSILSCGFAQFTMNNGHRWWAPLGDVLSMRLANEETALSFFREQGMPPSIEEKLKQWKNTNEGYTLFYPKEEYQQPSAIEQYWLQNKSKQTYMLYLLRFPGYTIEPLKEFFLLIQDPMDFYNAMYYWPITATTAWHRLTTISSIYHQLIPFMAMIACLFILIYFRNIFFSAQKFIVVYFFLLNIPLFLIYFHGDGMEPARHVMIISQNVFVGALLIFIFLPNWNLNKKRLKSDY